MLFGSDISEILQQLVNGLALGSVYALIALGYTMVYGIIRLINFAHGDVFMLGAYYGYYAITSFRVPFVLALPVSMGMAALTGILIERFAYRPLRRAPRIAALITAIGCRSSYRISAFSFSVTSATVSANHADKGVGRGRRGVLQHAGGDAGRRVAAHGAHQPVRV